MILFPAIDLYEGKAVRLYKGDYNQMTVYSDHPEGIAADFAAYGATHIHLVDLEGARSGETPNLETVLKIRRSTGLFCEIGGGIRSMEIVDRYLSAGLDRVILGTAAIEDEDFLRAAVDKYGGKIATGADIRGGFVSVKGWTQQSGVTLEAFCEKMESIGVGTVICTDISRDGAMRGTNREMYRMLSEKYRLNITASGGISTIADVKSLRAMNLYGAIIGKAYYTGDIDLKEAIEVAR